MKLFKKLGFTLAAFLVVPALALTQVKSAQAAQVPYDPNGTSTTTTPRFNMYTGVPSVNDESDFVRLRVSNGNPSSSAADNVFVDPLSATCNVGDMYDVRSYIHNGADPSYNQNGTGTAVAHDVRVSLTAPLGTDGNKFTFGSTVSASNAASVSDTGVLNCGKNVRLELVPSSVFVYSRTLGWIQANDSAVNGSMKIGSRSFGSGDVWACWDERIMVVYVVKVVEIPAQPVYTCDALTISPLSNRKYKYEVKSTATNGAVVKSVTVNYGDNTSGNSAITEHTYAADGTYQVVATVVFTVNGADISVTNDNCKKQLVVKGNECPTKPSVPVDDPSCKPCPTNPALNYDDNNCKVCPTNPKLNYDNKDCKKPSVLPKTGMGGITALASIGSIAGYIGHSVVTRKRNR